MVVVLGIGLALPALSQSAVPVRTGSSHLTTVKSVHARADGGLVFAAGAVVVPRAVVSAQLVNPKSGASTYTFKHDVDQLAELKPGNVMVLEGTAAGVVTGIRHSGSQLIVTTKAATLGQVIKSGSIRFSVTPNFSQAFTAPIDAGASASSDIRARPALDGRGVLPAGTSGGLSMQGNFGPFGYSLGGTVAGPGKLALSGQVCAGYTGSECANGPTTNPAWEIGVSGDLDLAKINGAVQVAGGGVSSVTAAFKEVKSELSMNYTFSRGDGGGGSFPKWPPFKIPFGWDIPIPNPYVPLFVRIQFAALVQVLTRPAKNTVTHGGLETTYAGNASTGETDGGAVSDSGGGDNVSGSVNPGKGGTGISLANLGIDLTFQEKAGIALGFSGANVMAFTDFTSTIGQEQASAIAGGFCSSYLGVSDWGVGLGAELGSSYFGVSGFIRKSLVQKTYNFTEPGCTPISS